MFFKDKSVDFELVSEQNSSYSLLSPLHNPEEEQKP